MSELALYPHQLRVVELARQFDVVGISGGVRNGKTRGVLAAALVQMYNVAPPPPNILRVGFIVLPTREPYWDNVRPEITRTWGWQRDGAGGVILDLNETKKQYTLASPDGGEPWLWRVMYAEDPDALRGATIAMALMIEAAWCPEEAFDQLLDRLVASGGKLFVDSSPNGLNWYWKRFVKGARLVVRYKDAKDAINGDPEENAEGDERIASIVGVPIEANRSLRTENVAKLRRNASRQRARREYDGEFFAASGLILPFDPNKYLTPDPTPEDLAKSKRKWEVLAGLDFGWGHPTAHAWAARSGSSRESYVYWLVDEYRESGLQLRTHALAIRRSPWTPYVKWRYADPSAAQSIAEIEEHGIRCSRGFNDVEVGLDRMAMLLERGRLKVARRCVKWVEEAGSYQRNPKTGKPVMLGEDLVCASRYMIASDIEFEGGAELPYGEASPLHGGRVVERRADGTVLLDPRAISDTVDSAMSEDDGATEIV